MEWRGAIMLAANGADKDNPALMINIPLFRLLSHVELQSDTWFPFNERVEAVTDHLPHDKLITKQMNET